MGIEGVGARVARKEDRRFITGAGRYTDDMVVPIAPHAGSESPRARVLLADDNADMRDYVYRMLSVQYDVVAVPDGLSALAAARKRRPDLVLADVMMPSLDGFGLVRELRSDPELSSVPVWLAEYSPGAEDWLGRRR